jgi:hypothetical protein
MFSTSSSGPLRRLALLTGTLAGSAALVATTAAPSGAASPQSKRSAAWLVTQLDGGLVESEYPDGTGGWVSYTDFGLALDVYYTFDQLGVRAPKRRQILRAIEPRAAEYTDAYGTTYAGAIGKLLTAVQTQGFNPSKYGDGDLLPRLEDLVVDSGPEQGRAKDVSDWEDSSNTFGQAFVATALTEARSSKAADAIEFLLKQQCAAGFFREKMNSVDFTCDSATTEQRRPDIDATASTALALRSLLPAAPVAARAEVRDALRSATRWLVSRQVRNGAFAGGRNTNSTGLAAVALHEAGRKAPARKAARWVNRFRVTPKMVRTTKLRPRDVGAVAYNHAALKQGKQSGLGRDARYQWRRATAQAAPALDVL